MDLTFAVVHEVEDDNYVIQPIGGGEALAARRSGPLTNLKVFPEADQLIAIDTSIIPPEIVQVYAEIEPAALNDAERRKLEQDTFPAIIARHTPEEKPEDPDVESRYMSWTGLAAQVWDPSGGDQPQKDHDYLKDLIEKNGGPALDIGCGTGRLLLRYLAAGLDVDGLDTSADMLAICRSKAAQQGLQVNLFHNSMHELNTPRKYKTIFIPCGTFCLLINREGALAALQLIYQQLQPEGAGF